MVSEGDEAPDFTAPLANGELDTFTRSEAPDEGGGPIVLAFFPGAFTSTCTHEMNTFQDRLESLTAHGGRLYGVSIDSPFSLNEFRDQLGLSFGLLSDVNRDLVRAYDVAGDFEDIGIRDIAQRSVFVIDESGTITYAWVAEDPGREPDYDAVEAAVGDAA